MTSNLKMCVKSLLDLFRERRDTCQLWCGPSWVRGDHSLGSQQQLLESQSHLRSQFMIFPPGLAEKEQLGSYSFEDNLRLENYARLKFKAK